MNSIHGQQPIQRSVGRRTTRDGRPLTPDDRAATAQMARYRTRAPKGVFIYRSAEQMQADRLKWTVDAILERHRERVRPKDQMDAAVIAETLRRLGAGVEDA